jgi:hypothetical protein
VKVLESKNNTISVAMTVGLEGKPATHLGSQLFTRGVSGTRVVTANTKVRPNKVYRYRVLIDSYQW